MKISDLFKRSKPSQEIVSDIQKPSLPSVLIACPTSKHKDYCLDLWLANVDKIRQSYQGKTELLIIDNTKDDPEYHKQRLCNRGATVIHATDESYKTKNLRVIMAENHNLILDYFLKSDHTFWFSLESDIIPPVDVIQTLVNHKKLITTGLYMIYEGYSSRLLAFENEDFGYARQSIPRSVLSSFNWVDGRLKQVKQPGIGCIMFHKEVFLKSGIRFRMDDLKRDCHDDTFLHEDIEKYGLAIYADTSVICEHHNRSWGKLKHENV